MSKHNYKFGGRVKISGKWYDINKFRMVQVDACREMELEKLEEFIQAYEPPKKEAIVHEWLDAEQFASIEGGRFTITNENVNRKLTELYGAPPIVRTYNGEEPEEFGLDYDDYVLGWDGLDWGLCAFSELALQANDQWMFQPPAPKEDD